MTCYGIDRWFQARRSHHPFPGSALHHIVFASLDKPWPTVLWLDCGSDTILLSVAMLADHSLRGLFQTLVAIAEFSHYHFSSLSE